MVDMMCDLSCDQHISGNHRKVDGMYLQNQCAVAVAKDGQKELQVNYNNA